MDVYPQLLCWHCVQKSLYKAFSGLVFCSFQYLVLCSAWVLESLCAHSGGGVRAPPQAVLAAMAMDTASKQC